MSTAHRPPRTADELPDDDHEAAYVLSGGLYDGVEQDRRARKLWPKRNCPPFVRKDPEMTERFHAAVLEHDRALEKIMSDVKSGKLKLEDISNEEIIGGLHKLAIDPRRPSVSLQAWKALAEMRGLIKNPDHGGGTSDDALERLLEERDAARRERSTGGAKAPEQDLEVVPD